MHRRPGPCPVRARDPDRHGEPRLRPGGRPLPVPERARPPLRARRRLPRRHSPVAAQLPGAHVRLDAGARRLGLLPRRRLPQRRAEHLRPDPLAGLRREHARPLRPFELGRLCAPPQPRGLLHARGGRLRRGRRPPERAPRRPAQRAPGGVHVHRPEPLQRRARLPGRKGRRLARAVGAADHVLAGVPVGADRALHHLRRGRSQRGQPRLHRGRGPIGASRHRLARGRSRTTRCCARRSSCSGCPRSAGRRRRPRWRARFTWPDRPRGHTRSGGGTVLPCRPDGQDTHSRREAVGRPGLRARPRRRLPEARGLPRVGRPHRVVGHRPSGRAGRAGGLRRGAQALVDQDTPGAPRAVQAAARRPGQASSSTS